METITTRSTATAEPILAIDLGKYKSVACGFRHPGFTDEPSAPIELESNE